MRSWLIVLIGFWLSWLYMDMRSAHTLEGLVLPLLFMGFLIALITKFTVLLSENSNRRHFDSDTDARVLGHHRDR